ncbi:MAG: heme-binding domain-containing protein [Ginsengibacter sp.]
MPQQYLEIPWYWNLPVAWFLNKYIQKGKKHLNFSEFSSYLAARQYKKLKEIAKGVKLGDMPLYSYTIIHRSTSLNEDQKREIENQVAVSTKEMENQYPADSLKRR